jgi:hypothetical protein
MSSKDVLSSAKQMFDLQIVTSALTAGLAFALATSGGITMTLYDNIAGFESPVAENQDYADSTVSLATASYYIGIIMFWALSILIGYQGGKGQDALTAKSSKVASGFAHGFSFISFGMLFATCGMGIKMYNSASGFSTDKNAATVATSSMPPMPGMSRAHVRAEVSKLRSMKVSEMTRDEAVKELQALVKEIAEHDFKYYAMNKPDISDKAYDMLKQRKMAIRQKFAGLPKKAHDAVQARVPEAFIPTTPMRSMPVDSLSREQAQKELVELIKELAYHDFRYYTLNAPQISDAAYDALKQRRMAIRQKFSGLVKKMHAAKANDSAVAAGKSRASSATSDAEMKATSVYNTYIAFLVIFSLIFGMYVWYVVRYSEYAKIKGGGTGLAAPYKYRSPAKYTAPVSDFFTY